MMMIAPFLASAIVAATPARAACPTIAPIPDKVCGRLAYSGICIAQPDKDGDGIPDVEEAELIDRFSPLLRFTAEKDGGSDKYHPMDMIDYIRNSDLVAHKNPHQLVIANSVLRAHPEQVVGGTIDLLEDYREGNCTAGENLRQEAAIQGLYDPHKDNNPDIGTYDLGADWSVLESKRNVGIYAHVSPFKPNSSADIASQQPVARLKDNGQLVIPRNGYEDVCLTDKCYKLEYYQFFGFNQAWAPYGYANHQADLAILTEVYDKNQDKILAVSHWAHGYEMRYDLVSPKSQCARDYDNIIGTQMTCLGENHSHNPNILTVNLLTGDAHQDDPQHAQNNRISFACDSVIACSYPQQYTHPVIFVEAGSHEFWPTSKWSAQYAPSHAGNDPYNHYITKNIPNLGEIEHPLGTDAQTILWYNGFWGNWNKSNDVSPGPVLHAAWNWYLPDGRPPISPSQAER